MAPDKRMRLGDLQLRAVPLTPFGLEVHGLDGVQEPDYLGVLLGEKTRAAFFDLVAAQGLVSCIDLVEPAVDPPAPYRDVRGRSSRGRLSPGEFFHHDGCSGPTNPRVVEIRCPRQDFPRQVATAVAPFSATVNAQLAQWVELIERGVGEPDSALSEHAGTIVPHADLNFVQGRINRWLRRTLGAEDARAYFRRVDEAAGAVFQPWRRGESRFIANENARGDQIATWQHRRAYREVHHGGRAEGRLIKRWPPWKTGEDEELVSHP
jgi:hypothetical protein